MGTGLDWTGLEWNVIRYWKRQSGVQQDHEQDLQSPESVGIQ